MKIKNIWTDPVTATVIATGVITVLGWLGRKLLPILEDLISNQNYGIFDWKYFSLLVVIILLSFVAIPCLICINNFRRKLLVNKYSDNNYFRNMFSENNSGKNIYSSIAGNNQVISLLMDLEDDRLVKKNGDQYPELTFLGRRIRDHFKKYELGAFN